MEILKHFMPKTVLYPKRVEIFWTTKQNVTSTLQVNKGWSESHRTKLSLAPSIRWHFSVLCKDAVNCWHYIVSVIEKWVSIELMYIQPVLYSQNAYKFNSIQQLQNDIDREKQKYSVKNLSQCHFFCQKTLTDWPGIEPGPPYWG
jgi:hypothetical protein